MNDPLKNVEAEAELLGSLMQDNWHIDRAADLLTPADFSEALHGNIYAAILREAALGKPVNPITLKGYFENDEAIKVMGGPVYLMQLNGQASGLVTQETAKQVAELAERRRMRAGLEQAMLDCDDLTLSTGEVISATDAALSVTGKDLIHQPTGAECFDELIAGFDDKTNGVECVLIPALDELLGQMRPKQLVIGAGRPGMGKTALALSYALGAAQNGSGVLFVSLEMSSKELAARMAADLCFGGEVGVPYSAIRDGDLSVSQRREVVKAGSMMRGLPFSVVDVGNLTIGRLNMLVRRHARKMAAQGHKLELVIIDYLQLMSPDSKGRSQYEAVSEVSRGLKAIAKDNDLAVFALAQLSRSVENRPEKRPQLSDLRDSGQIEQDADAVLFLLRQEYYLKQAEPEPMHADRLGWERLMDMHRGKIEFIVAKRRNGTTGSAFGDFHGTYQAVRS